MFLRPHEFYEMDNADFFLAMKGTKEKLIDQKRDMRRMALIIVSPHVKDMPSAMKIWPIENDDELRAEINKGKELTAEEHNKNFSKLVSMFKTQRN